MRTLLFSQADLDEFFILDSWRLYWDELVGEKHLRYVPNSNYRMLV
jgi:PhoPQ-activated pathogenicity-related protein